MNTVYNRHHMKRMPREENICFIRMQMLGQKVFLSIFVLCEENIFLIHEENVFLWQISTTLHQMNLCQAIILWLVKQRNMLNTHHSIKTAAVTLLAFILLRTLHTATLNMEKSNVKKRKLLTLEQRVQVIEKHANGVSMKKLSEEYGCGATQIFTIIKNKDTIKEKWINGKRADSRYIYKDRNQKYPKLNRRVREFYDECLHKCLPISGAHIKEQAMFIAVS